MKVSQLCSLNVADIADDDCLLAMWWVAPMPVEALAVVKAWGFELKTMKGFTWHKRTANGKSHLGMGHWTRANTEDCLFAVRGRPVRVSKAVRQFIDAPRRRHSQKPDEARDRLVQPVGEVPRIELFARVAVSGWDVWGNEVESSVSLPSLIDGVQAGRPGLLCDRLPRNVERRRWRGVRGAGWRRKVDERIQFNDLLRRLHRVQKVLRSGRLRAIWLRVSCEK